MSCREYGRFTHAVVRSVPDSLGKSIGSIESIDLAAARLEHSNYVQHLRTMGLTVIQVPADESLPDCSFVEDTAVICDQLALITRPGHPVRHRETTEIRRTLKQLVRIDVVEMNQSNAFLDGGDVLFTGREFFVGLSDRTNFEGADFLARTFPDYRVTAIQMPPGVLHLKSVISMAGPGLICCSRSLDSQDVVQQIGRTTQETYQLLTLPDPEPANCVFANGCLMHRSEFPNSLRAFEARVTCRRLPVGTYHLSKSMATLTSMCLLIDKSAPH